MKKCDIKSGGVYLSNVGDRVVRLRIVCHDPSIGWVCRNLDTGRRILIDTARKFSCRIDVPSKG